MTILLKRMAALPVSMFVSGLKDLPRITPRSLVALTFLINSLANHSICFSLAVIKESKKLKLIPIFLARWLKAILSLGWQLPPSATPDFKYLALISLSVDLAKAR